MHRHETERARPAASCAPCLRAARRAASRRPRAPRHGRPAAWSPGRRPRARRACASATAMARPAACSMGASGVSSPTQAQCSSADRSRLRESCRAPRACRSTPWMHVPDAELARAPRDRGRLAAGNDGDGDAGRRHLLDAVPVPHVENLQRFSARAVVQAPVGEHAVDVQHQQLHAPQRRQEASRHGDRSQHPGAQQVVHVERADQRARVVDHGQRGDAGVSP